MPRDAMTAEVLDRELLAAHAASEPSRLARLYARAADMAETEGEVPRTCFFLTQAWIFALESGVDEAAALKSRLVAHGRDK